MTIVLIFGSRILFSLYSFLLCRGCGTVDFVEHLIFDLAVSVRMLFSCSDLI